jgi:glutathione peroxidase
LRAERGRTNKAGMSSVYDFSAKAIDGSEKSLGEYRGKALLIVNVASKCGFTPQYRGLEAMYRRLKDKGFEILGFPCDQFGHQEPGDEAEIQSFCSTTYDVTFPLFSKIDVNGNGAHPLYKYLKSEEKGLLGTESIKWNFTKFLVDKQGNVIKRFAPKDSPESIEKDIERVL